MAGIKHKTRGAGTKINTSAVWDEPHEIEGGAIDTTEIADGAVTTAKIGANAVTSDKIAPDTVIAADIATGGVGTDELAANAVTSAKLAEGVGQVGASYIIYKKDSTYYARNGTDGAIDATEANLHTAFNTVKATIGNNPGTIALKGQLTLTDTLDLTNIRDVPFCVDLRGAKITAEINNKPIFDLTGSHDGIMFLGGFITTGTTPTTKPNVGLLMARKSDNSSAGQHKIVGTIFEGYYPNSTLYMYGSEENVFLGGYLRNREDNTKVISFNSGNPSSLTSAFQTIATGEKSSTVLNVYGGHIINYGASGQAVYVKPDATSHINGLNFYGTMIAALGSGFYLDLAGSGDGTIGNLTLADIRITDTIPAYSIYAPASGNAKDLYRIAIRGGIIQSSTKEVSIGANITPTYWLIDRDVWFVDNNGLTFTVAPTNSSIYHPSFKTRNSGTATIGNGTETTGNIAHGLGGTPTVVFAMGSTTDTEDLYCDSKDATNIVIKCVGAVGGDRTIYWHAECNP